MTDIPKDLGARIGRATRLAVLIHGQMSLMSVARDGLQSGGAGKEKECAGPFKRMGAAVFHGIGGADSQADFHVLASRAGRADREAA